MQLMSPGGTVAFVNMHLAPSWSVTELEQHLRKLRAELPRAANAQWILGGDTNITPEDEGPYLGPELAPGEEARSWDDSDEGEGRLHIGDRVVLLEGWLAPWNLDSLPSLCTASRCSESRFLIPDHSS